MRRRYTAYLPLLIIGIALLFGPSQTLAARLGIDARRLLADVAAITGSVMVRDVDTGTPSLQSDRLIVQLNGVATTPSGFTLQSYLLSGEDGFFSGTLAVNGGVVNSAPDFPGNNLIAKYDTFRMMWEKTVFETTLPSAALALIREVVDRAGDTPKNVGYAVGMVQQARILATHANLARSSAAAGNRGGARVHTEHTLNILYGKDDPRYGDFDGSGVAENPGDGYGLLRYAANTDFKLLEAAESVGVTQEIADQAIAASLTIGNVAPADGNNTWADQLVERAQTVLAAATAGDALPPATTMRDISNRMVNGVDVNENGVVEPITGEGGVWTAFLTAQRTADYFPSGAIGGLIQHQPFAQNPTSDRIAIALENVPQPPDDVSLWAYLLGAGGKRLVLGEVPWSSGGVTVSFSYQGRNLIGEFNGFRLVQGVIYAKDALPAAPLGPIRKVLSSADDTPAQVGYGVGLMRQAQLVRDLAAQMSAAASADDIVQAQARAREALNVLVGKDDPRYQTGAGDPGDGFGLLGYAGSVDLSMQQLLSSAGVTANMTKRGGEARAAIANFFPATGTGTWADLLIEKIQAVLGTNDVIIAAPFADQAAAIANNILNGDGSKSGVRAVYLASQQAVDYFPKETGAAPPDEPPVAGPNPDAQENDDLCSRAKPISTNGVNRRHTFHYEGDQDWISFTTQANKSYVIEVSGVGNLADPVIFLYDNCESAPGSFESNAFGNTVRLTWNAAKNGAYFIQLRQFDPVIFGVGTEYDLKITLDAVPPSPPTNLRCLAVNTTTLAIQWQRSPEFDVTGYRVTYGNQNSSDTGIRDVAGAETTFLELSGLTPNELYFLRVTALDFSRNESAPSGELQCRPLQPTDATKPVVTSMLPTLTGPYTTTAPALTFTGAAADSGGNLSRVRVRNTSISQEKTDFSLAQGIDDFRVEDLPLRIGNNQILVTVFDEANNSTDYSLAVERLGESKGAVIIIAGQNETLGLQTNIYNSTNRAYRIFKSAGFTDDDIFYLAPVAQDPDKNGVADEVDAASTPANFQQAITVWAGTRVDADKPLFIYMMDHGLADKFCISGCAGANSITPDELDGWLRTLESESGVTEVTVVYEACLSGSFIHRVNPPGDSISKPGRVIITSTGFDNNAYASAQGAYFSDAFFSCVADSGNLKACFDQGKAAVATTGVNQTPFLDDNGDGVFNEGDGTFAVNRYVTRFFSSVRPTIDAVDVQKSGVNGVLSATVSEGAEQTELVWAAVYGPTFEEPTDATIFNLNVPVVRLEPVAGQPGKYSVNYPNGFLDPGDYRVVFYAQDRLGLNAAPVSPGQRQLFLPQITRKP
ncbi:MAG: fibronectin type III domain-containing protein [Chloroflexi bacterium]|nr:fibronectin type III domain-containing protein [Chloroflexota bacterium]